MERYWSHPLNVGWVNLFGRWATTPLFRDWWPVLSPMYSPRVARFIEEQFNLPSTRTTRALKGSVDKHNQRQGVAWEIWQSMHRADPIPAKTVWRYEMELESGLRVNAAIVFVDDSVPGEISWKHEDFFVPPSFWGARIGQLFLRAIPRTVPLRVTIKHDPAHKKEFSDAMQLYREAGFKPRKMPATTREVDEAVMVRD
jgi:GNAT superfamily N-acetyltransferase